MEEDAIAGAQAYVNSTDSVGQKRMSSLHGGRKPKDLRELEWHRICGRASASCVTVQAQPWWEARNRLLRASTYYRDAGIDVLIASGMPLLEEAYRFAELVLPLLPVAKSTNQGVTSAFTKDRDAGGEHRLRHPGASMRAPARLRDVRAFFISALTRFAHGRWIANEDSFVLPRHRHR